MPFAAPPPGFFATTEGGAGRAVGDEPAWRALPHDCVREAAGGRVIATRWHAVAEQPQEVGAATPEDCHVVKIVLRSTSLQLTVDGRTVQDGVAMPGMVHVTDPGAAVRGLFRGAYDILHLHVPRRLIAEWADALPEGAVPALGLGAPPRRDPAVERLARALIGADQLGGAYGRLYADGVSLAIVARLASARPSWPQERPKVTELARWRLKRAIDYVEVHLGDAVSLADLAAAAGLTRMHFAAQFRASTGVRPHEYLLRRRIERAQEMLGGTGLSLVQIALAVGFQTQSHFTAVFKRYVGQPPHAWRQAHAEGMAQERRAWRRM